MTDQRLIKPCVAFRPTSNPVLEIEGLVHRLEDPDSGDAFVLRVEKLLAIPGGSFVALLGPSGCGKTTLLSVMGLLRRPSDLRTVKRFQLWVEEDSHRKEYDLREVWRTDERRIERLRRRHLGFALQSGELLPSLTVAENISIPLELNGIHGAECRARVDQLIGAFGLAGEHSAAPLVADRSLGTSAQTHVMTKREDLSRIPNARIHRLSGGEYQRVALARAIAHRPELVFVDEPTANLNCELARGALAQLQLLQRQDPGKTTVLMITHDVELAREFADMVIYMAPLRDCNGGEVVEVKTTTPTIVPNNC